MRRSGISIQDEIQDVHNMQTSFGNQGVSCTAIFICLLVSYYPASLSTYLSYNQFTYLLNWKN